VIRDAEGRPPHLKWDEAIVTERQKRYVPMAPIWGHGVFFTDGDGIE
jgi:hypothetical protein